MILPDFKAFPRSGRLLGIDWGARRTGVAVSDASREFVFVRPPILTPRGSDSQAREIAHVATAEDVVGIIIGLPLRGDGTESETTAAVRRNAAEICTYSDFPIVFLEENLTSVAAQDEMGKVRKSDIKQRLDSEAARLILENAIALINRMQ